MIKDALKVGYELHYWENNGTAELDFVLHIGSLLNIHKERGAGQNCPVTRSLYLLLKRLLQINETYDFSQPVQQRRKARDWLL